MSNSLSIIILRATLLALPFTLAGCASSFLSGAGPSISAINENEGNQYTVIDLSADTIGPYMRAPQRVYGPDVALPDMPEIKLMPGDVLQIMVTDSSVDGALFAPLAAGGTVFEGVRLDSKGHISLPYIGSQNVRGKTLAAVETQLRKALKGLASDPQVHVSITGDLSGSVLVAGAVKTPGRFSALQGPLTLLDAINQAGGPVLEPHLINVVVRTGKKAYHFNYDELLSGKNQLVPPNSEIVLERARKRFVAMGAVVQSGLHDLPSNNPSLLEVLGVVGGLNEAKSDASGVFIFRLHDGAVETSDRPVTPRSAEVFRLNLKNPAAMFLARQFLVQPEDAIYVTNAAVYEWQKIISPIVQVLVLGRVVDGF
ncbi:polysaccharide biosynthesis/export family protein [Pusillimonas sp. CC-YST705]|uniref:Polysaccharide biosynthesis/export family protein n=1 Tax=Mesopusillimonas faecipullorum TaxID=2755040 RepID=A0ABS8CAG3_9BURK|nr:polysaccharide biosynthesis/export family protein [Mesopusillimonas faecipullorum]MCB5363027.1 polysaccharide biosynthesis/export family protein [Mesopusillimonas faecipullorum]